MVGLPFLSPTPRSTKYVRTGSWANDFFSLLQKQPDKQISQIEKSVTHLLVATKQLLETLTQWSRRQASENEVSDVYVRLGYEFNLACRAFTAIGVDISDLGPVPDLLRTILEDTLSQDASPQSLDRYLPRIRDIIINLLHGLKKKQARLRSRQQREDSRGPGRQNSGTGQTAMMNQMYEEAASSATSPRRTTGRRHGSDGSAEEQSILPRAGVPGQNESARGTSYSEREASRQETQHILTQSSPPENAMTSKNQQPAPSSHTAPAYPPPPPTPKQDDALGALQRSGELERRASRRFSAYQINKHLGTPTNGVPVLPTQNSPVPNRGRDVRESLNAVRLRGSNTHGRQKSSSRPQEQTNAKSGSQSQTATSALAASEGEHDDRAGATDDSSANDAPTPEIVDGLKEAGPDTLDKQSLADPALDFPRPPEEPPSLGEAFEPSKDTSASSRLAPATPTSGHRVPSTEVSTPPREATRESPEQPSPGKELTLFLQYKSKIKKYVLPEGPSSLTIGRLQLAFIEKFAWNTHNNGVDLPEIYIQDPVSGVRHELEDLADVKDRAVLVLNVDAVDEMRKHFDDGFGGVRRLVEGLKGTLDGQESMIQRVSDRQLEAAKEMARLAAAPAPVQMSSSPKAVNSIQKGPITANSSQLAELQSLRRDMAVMRQTYADFSADITSSMTSIRSKATSVKSVAADVSVPSFEGDAGRSRITSGKKELADESERLVSRVDDLQDLVEDLRKDVVTRGVRPLPRQLETVGKDIGAVSNEMKKMQDFLKREKPIWTKIWEKELQLVCEERDQLTMQEDLAADLQDDLEKASQTFALVEQATRQQAMQTPTDGAGGGVTLRSTGRNLAIEPAADPLKAKDGVLGEVRALQPNHESRLEAIQRAEKARKKELETRRIGKFQKELGSFVEQGKLKKSGGVEEAERLRRAKDERMRKEVWERQQARNAEMEKAEAEATAAAAAAAAEGGGEDQGESAQLEEPTDENTAEGENEEPKDGDESVPTEQAGQTNEEGNEDEKDKESAKHDSGNML